MSISNLIKTIKSIVRVLVHSRYRNSYLEVAGSEAPCVVFGNGPSLNGDIREILDALVNLDTFCVGRFAESDLYKPIKPKYYVFADSMWWSSHAPQKTIEIRNRLFGIIVNETDWDLKILVPFEAEMYFKRVFSDIPNISISYYNNVPLWGDSRIIHALFDLDLGMPAAQNVLIAGLFLAIRRGYKKIVILGADHSWHETLGLDDLNRVCLKDRHFYDKEAVMKPFTMDGSDEKIFTMDKLFHAIGRMFEGYWQISAYAKKQNVQIINASSVTYIDAFKRMRVVEVFFEKNEKPS